MISLRFELGGVKNVLGADDAVFVQNERVRSDVREEEIRVRVGKNVLI